MSETLTVGRRRLTLAAMCIAQGMILLDVTIVNIALPSIQRELHESAGSLEWVVSAYALSLATLIPLSGTLGDRFGRRRFFVLGMVIFAVGSIACALSGSDLALIGSRALQGVGGAMMSALTLSILSETYPKEIRAGAIGVWATCSGLGFGLGPVVGGLLLSRFDWSSIFWVNLPFAIVGIALGVTVVPESRDPVTRKLDLPGVGASALGLLALTFGLIESSSHHWGSWYVAAPLVVGGASLALFAVWEQRAKSPMAPPALLRLRSFGTSCGVYLFGYAALAGVMFYVTLLYQNVNGWSALRTGISWLAMNGPFLAMAQFAGRLNRRFPPNVVVGTGCLGAAAGILLLGAVTPSTPWVLTGAGYVLLGAGYGTLVPGVTNVAMRDVPQGFSGVASGILNASRQIGTSVGLAVLGTIGANAAVSEWSTKLRGFPASAQQMAAGQAHNVAGAQIGAITKALGSTYRSAAVDSFAHGYRLAVTIAGLCLLAAGALASWGMRQHQGRRSLADAPAEDSYAVDERETAMAPAENFTTG
jgi:MFS transporter, DHA2 family, methylenomycin A resistance protein